MGYRREKDGSMDVNKLEQYLRDAACECAQAADDSLFDEEIVQWMSMYEDIRVIMNKALEMRKHYEAKMNKA